MLEWLLGQPKTTAQADDDDDDIWPPDDARIPDDVKAQYGTYRDTVAGVAYRACKDADEYWLLSDNGDLIDILSIRLLASFAKTRP